MLASPDRGGGRATCTECDALISAVPSSRGRAQWTVRFLKGGAVVDAISFALSLWVVLAPGENFVRDLAGGFSGLTVLVAYFGAATLFLRWQHLVMRQLIQWGRGFKVTSRTSSSRTR